MRLKIIVLFIGTLFCCNAFSQKYDAWFKIDSRLPITMQKQMKQLRLEFNGIYMPKIDSSEAIRVRGIGKNEALKLIDNEKNFDKLFPVTYWQAVDSNYMEFIPFLIDRITNTTLIGLNQADDILIWERLTEKQKAWIGYAYIINDDLYQIAGRANFLLKKISGENFGDIRIKNNPEKLLELKEKWKKWYKSVQTNLKKPLPKP
jgi:hypothetical protein